MTERARESSESPRPPSTCPDCACTELKMLSDGQFVTVYKCPQCGKLIAPVKKH
jgi:ribosomal protein L37AE/L43A